MGLLQIQAISLLILIIPLIRGYILSKLLGPERLAAHIPAADNMRRAERSASIQQIPDEAEYRIRRKTRFCLADVASVSVGIVASEQKRHAVDEHHLWF